MQRLSSIVIVALMLAIASSTHVEPIKGEANDTTRPRDYWACYCGTPRGPAGGFGEVWEHTFKQMTLLEASKLCLDRCGSFIRDECCPYKEGAYYPVERGSLYPHEVVYAWGPWIDIDDPADTFGDWETLTLITPAFPGGCLKPIDIECRTVDLNLDWREVGEDYTCDLETGGLCLNGSQLDGSCRDYKVRMVCPCE